MKLKTSKFKFLQFLYYLCTLKLLLYVPDIWQYIVHNELLEEESKILDFNFNGL